MTHNGLDEELSMRTIKSYQEQVQQLIDKILTAAELQYNALSSVTFTYAGKDANVLSIKTSHDKLSYMTYRKARELNNLVGLKASEVIVRFEKPQTIKEKAKAASQLVLDTSNSKATAFKSTVTKVTNKAVKKVEDAVS